MFLGRTGPLTLASALALRERTRRFELPEEGRSLADAEEEMVAVVGLGRFGGALALELHQQGTEVLAVDHRLKVVQSFAGRLPHVATADATDIEALRLLGVSEFCRVVVAIGTDVEASIITRQIIRRGTFTRVPDLIDAIRTFMDAYNERWVDMPVSVGSC
ncbi:NAD(P)-binding protein [Micromonospora coriariae]